MMEEILGISPGANGIGLAILQNGKLIDWKLQYFRVAWSNLKLKTIIHFVDEYINHHKVVAIAIKIPDELPVSYSYIQLVASLNALFERKGILPMYYMLSELKKHYCHTNKASKAELFAEIVKRYPDLWPEHNKERINKNCYYAKVFEAVAAANLLANQQRFRNK